jgi:ATP-binding protein involved in chromosome partitioning
MAYFVAPGDTTRHEIFGCGGGVREATRLGVPFLGSLPLDPELRIASDNGVPLVLSHPELPVSSLIQKAAESLVPVLR